MGILPNFYDRVVVMPQIFRFFSGKAFAQKSLAEYLTTFNSV
jgi:hypothetical protein